MMFSISKRIEKDEEILFEVDKIIWPIPTSMISIVVCLLAVYGLVIPCFRNMFLGTISFDSFDTYVISIFILLTFSMAAIIFPISYFGSQFVMTDKRIFVRSGMRGKLYVVSYSDIAGYKHIEMSSKGRILHMINLYLTSGTIINSTELFICKESLPTLLHLLETRVKNFENVITSTRAKKEFQQNCTGKNNTEIISNAVIPIVEFFPIVLAIVMALCLICGVNKVSVQSNISITGVVESKNFHYDNHNNIDGFIISVLDSTSGIDYDIPVTIKTFNKFRVKDNVTVSAKKGALGIVYDTVIHKR